MIFLNYNVVHGCYVWVDCWIFVGGDEDEAISYVESRKKEVIAMQKHLFLYRITNKD